MWKQEAKLNKKQHYSLARLAGSLAYAHLKTKVCLFDFVFRFVWLLFENVRNKKMY